MSGLSKGAADILRKEIRRVEKSKRQLETKRDDLNRKIDQLQSDICNIHMELDKEE